MEPASRFGRQDLFCRRADPPAGCDAAPRLSGNHCHFCFAHAGSPYACRRLKTRLGAAGGARYVEWRHPQERDLLATLSQAKQRHAAYYSIVLQQAQEHYLRGGGAAEAALATYDPEAPNVMAAIGWAVDQWPRDREAARLCSDFMGYGLHILDLRLPAQARVPLLRAALEAARSLADLSAQGVHLGNLGLACSALGRLDEAMECHEEALVIDVRTDRRNGQAANHLNMASIHYRRGDFDRAISGYEEAVEQFRALGSRRGEAEALGNLGLVFTVLLRVDDADRVLREQLRISREEGDRVGTANALGCLGVLCDLREDYPGAVELYEESLRESRAIGDREAEAVRLGNLGIAYKHLGNVRRARELFHQQLRISREAGRREVEGDALASLASVHDGMGEHGHALELYDQAILAAREAGDVHGQAIRMYNRSMTLARVAGPGAAADAAFPAMVMMEMMRSPHAREVKTRIALWRLAALAGALRRQARDTEFATTDQIAAFLNVGTHPQ
ncbi:MAG TPA: tetratricopeptide repeat protein [Longimicrobium sp.]|nr:tetratricopeptide repeat protein [Longimicrobium sp.]